MNKNKNYKAIDLDEMIGKVYFEIATWHNKDGSGEEKQVELRLLSREIVAMILNDAFSQLDGIKTSEMVVPKTKKKKRGFIL